MERHSPHEIKSGGSIVLKLLFAFELALLAAIAVLLVLIYGKHKLGSQWRKAEASEVDVISVDGDGGGTVSAAPVATEAEPLPSATPQTAVLPTQSAEASLEPTEQASPLPTASPTPKDMRINGPIKNKDVTFISRGVQVTAAICMPETTEPCPVVVLAHGFDGDKDAGGGFAHIANALYESGVASIRIDFSGCGSSTESSTAYCLTEMQLDIKAAADYMITNYRVDANELGLIGYSLGGRAVLEAIAASALRPKAVLLIAPAASTADFIRLIGGRGVWEARRSEAMESGKTELAGMELGYDFFREMDENESPTQAAAAVYSGKAAVVYSNNDQAVLPRVSQSVAEALNCETLVLSGAGHAYGLYGGPDNDYLNKIIALAVRLFG